jgi:hypothetical protein
MATAPGRAAQTPTVAIAVAAACLLGAEGIHTAVIAEHFTEWWAEGAFFLALSIVEGVLAAALLVTPALRTCQAAAALVSVATIGVWVWSRTTGLPIGPEAGYPELVGRADTVATLLEALTALALIPAILRPASAGPRPREGSRPRISTAAAVVAVALATAFGLAGADNHAHHTGDTAPAPINVAASASRH